MIIFCKVNSFLCNLFTLQGFILCVDNQYLSMLFLTKKDTKRIVGFLLIVAILGNRTRCLVKNDIKKIANENTPIQQWPLMD